MFRKILIANRGEIACRVIRTARRMGIATVAVYSEADAEALHVRMADEAVRIGPAPSAESYLEIDRIVEACRADRRRGGSSRLRLPLGERGLRRGACEGRHRLHRPDRANAIAAMGDKIESKKLARAAGVTTVPGHLDVIPDAETAVAIAREIGYPVMIKASAGGGGKGMRIAASDERGARRVSLRRERGEIELRRRPRLHREIHRRAAPHRDPGARRRARQRRLSRRARMLDPAPPPEGHRGGAEPVSRRRETRAAMGAQAVALAQAVDYRSAGTVEFIVDRAAQFLFPRDEHAAPGRASGHRAGDRARSRRADDPRRRRRDAPVRPAGCAARRAGRSRRGSMPRTRRAISCRRSAASCAISRRAGKAFGSTPGSSKAPRSASTTTR